MKIPYRNPWFIGAVIVIVIAAIWWFMSRPAATAAPVTSAVTSGTLVQSVSGTGSLIPKIQSDVTSPDYGRVDTILVKNGDEVTADQPLIKFHSLASAADKAKALASLLSSQDSLNQAQTKLTTLGGSIASTQQQLQDAQKNEKIASTSLTGADLALKKSKNDSSSTIANAEKAVTNAQIAQSTAGGDLSTQSADLAGQVANTDLKSARISVQQSINSATASYQQAQRDKDSASLKTQSAQATFDVAQKNLQNQQVSIAAAQASYTASKLNYQMLSDQMVTAPVSGRIVNLSITPGQIVGTSGNSSSSSSSNSTSNSSSGGTLFSIIDFNSMRATVAISEVDISSVKLDQPATLTFDALPDKTFAGTVTNVDTVGTTTSGVITYNAEITLASLSPELKPGMSVTASIVTNTEEHVLLVPSIAIHTASGQTTVNVLNNDGTTKTVTVTIGDANDSDTVVTQGLSEGDKVITSATTTATGGGTTSLFGGGAGGFGGGGGAVRGAHFGG